MIKTFVFDTNSLISANLSSTSINRKAYDKARETGIIIYSEYTLKEFSETFSRSKFDNYISNQQRSVAVSAFKINGQQIEVYSVITACRDPKDNKFLKLAVDAQATCIITGDKDLLVLYPFNGIPILSAADFLGQF